ncbi:MAG: nitrile hydratase subunit beta [Rhodospirillaceae bacterium]|nr:nitrile hydratase subunit beta [Rhodospirillaceae bacterium]
MAPLAARDGQPGFDEPWQAELMAIAHTLATQGLFTQGEWSEALGAERARDAAGGVPDDQEHYYEAALRALEKLTTARGAVTDAMLDARQAQWHRAYEKTPHGDPVRLEAGDQD